jgi:hypothetical protein
MLTAFYMPVILCSIVFGAPGENHCAAAMTLKGSGEFYRSEDDCLKALRDSKLTVGQRRACWRFDVEDMP